MNTGPARGMRDFLPEDVRRRQYVIGVIADVYQKYGFEPIETPAVENLETLQGKYGEEGDRLIFKILKRGEGAETGQADLALRYDLTVPLARVVAEYGAKLPRFFKRYQVQPVWRADRPQKGRFREFYQCDVDAIGSTSPVVEAELCNAVSDVLLRLGFNDFELVINHRRLLTGILNGSGIEVDRHPDVLAALDKIDKVGAEGVEKDLMARGLEQSAAQRLLRVVGAPAQTDWLGWLEQQMPLDDDGRAGVENLREILRLTERTSAGAHIRIEPSLARGLGYYTGAIFEVKVQDLAGSLGGGGRYDDLVGMFSGQQVPAAGFSLGLERILVVMGERAMFPPGLAATPADVMIAVWNETQIADLLQLAATLRAAGLRVEMYPEADKVGKQFKYASARNIPFVAVIGDEELANGTVAVKNMKSGEQAAYPRATVAAQILSVI